MVENAFFVIPAPAFAGVNSSGDPVRSLPAQGQASGFLPPDQSLPLRRQGSRASFAGMTFSTTPIKGGREDKTDTSTAVFRLKSLFNFYNFTKISRKPNELGKG